MDMRTDPSPPPWTIVLTGFLALAIAMGIGRFAFTPLMPLMLRDGTLDTITGTEWAAANYIGYLVGALTASWFGRAPQRGMRVGLVGVVLTTAAMAWGNASLPWMGAALRGGAGVFSAWVLVCASSWCLPELARRQSGALSGWMYTGVGVGIALTGFMAWLGGNQPADQLWLVLALSAAAGTVFVLRGLAGDAGARAQVGASPEVPGEAEPPPRAQGHLGLMLCYSAFGFGYIVPATYLPTMARQLVSDPMVFGLTWPVFGTAAALSVALASRWLASWPRRKLWAAAHAAMALGTLLPLCQHALWTLTASAVLVGGTFMVATMAGLQLARERMPANPTPLLARMTAGFALGQIAGPLLVRVLGPAPVAGWDALHWAGAASTALLAASSLWLWRGDAALPTGRSSGADRRPGRSA